ncbi:MAG: OsmC family protein [Methanobacteriota archaeon]
MARRSGSAVWKGGLKDGKGVVSTESGVLRSVAYNFSQRFEDAKGTNPEELIAAAHAACFSMALSGQLGNANLKPESIDTKCTVTFEKQAAGWTVTESHLEVTARVPGADAGTFQDLAEAAKKGCPISRLLNTNVTMTARLA